MQGLQALNQFKSFVSKIGGLGRYEDTYIVHAAEGETVVPMEVLDRNPVLKKRLFKTMMDMGIEPGRYIVGNELNSKNPITGQPEFFLKYLGRRLRKAAADISGYAAPVVGAIYGPGAGAATGALLGQYKRENPGDPTQGLNMAIRGGLAGIGSNIAGGRTGLDMFTGTGLSGGEAGFSPKNIFDFYKQDGKLGDYFMNRESGKSNIREYMESFLGTGDKSSDKETLSKLVDQLDAEKISKEDFAEAISKLGSDDKKGLASMLKAGVPLTLALGYLFDKTTSDEPVGMEVDPLPAGSPYQGILNPKLTYGSSMPITSYPAMAEGGVMDLQDGGESVGPGTGTSDSIPAMLSDGEFVMTAKAVRGAGGGDRREGARKMYEAMDKLEARA
jgi:hypothetical protein